MHATVEGAEPGLEDAVDLYLSRTRYPFGSFSHNTSFPLAIPQTLLHPSLLQERLQPSSTRVEALPTTVCLRRFISPPRPLSSPILPSLAMSAKVHPLPSHSRRRRRSRRPGNSPLIIAAARRSSTTRSSRDTADRRVDRRRTVSADGDTHRSSRAVTEAEGTADPLKAE